MFCSKCGQQNSDSGSFCIQCGQSLQMLPSAPEISGKTGSLFSEESTTRSQHASPSPRTDHKGKAGLIIALAISGLVLISALLILFLGVIPMLNKESGDRAADTTAAESSIIGLWSNEDIPSVMKFKMNGDVTIFNQDESITGTYEYDEKTEEGVISVESGDFGFVLSENEIDIDEAGDFTKVDDKDFDIQEFIDDNRTTTTTAAATTAATTMAAAETTAAAINPKDIYIPIISKGLQHQFWQVVKKGADDAAAKYGITITFEGPSSESEIAAQVTMLDNAIAKKPSAICLATLSTDSVIDQLNKCLASKIPVIGFDSGVPGAPDGSIWANASTDNNAAGALAATSMFPAIEAQIKAATVAAPVRIAVLSQDATSESVKGRTKGFIDKMLELVKADGIADVAVVGHDMYKNGVAEKSAAVIIDVAVSATTAAADLEVSASALLNKNPISIFASGESSANGILDASNEGADLGTIVAVGFDAGIRQKTAVEAGYFLGSITQDPYNIGYQAVELAYKAVMGETVADVDTGAKFYTAANMNDGAIKDLVYD